MPDDPFAIFALIAKENSAPVPVRSLSPVAGGLDLAILLDRSASMEPVRHQALRAYNGIIKDQQRARNVSNLDLWLFSDEPNLALSTTNLDAAFLARAAYELGSGTSLFDAVIHAVAQTEKRPGNNKVFVIVSDGADTTSRSSPEACKEVVAAKLALGWKFYFVGTAEAARSACDIGIPADSVLLFGDGIELGRQLATVSRSLLAWRTNHPAPRKANGKNHKTR